MKAVTALLSIAVLFAVHPSLLHAGTLELSYSTYLGGNGSDYGAGIALGTGGEAYIAGDTFSTDFPTSNPYQASCANGYDVFITKLGSSGSVLAFSTYLGGSDSDEVRGITLGTGEESYIVGSTRSVDFPTENPYQASNNGRSDVFVSKLGSSGSVLAFSTYLGGYGDCSGMGIALGMEGGVYITGQTYSLDFPTNNPYQASSNAGEYADAFITKLDSCGSVLAFSTYLGGNGSDCGAGIALGTGGEAYIAGDTFSTDFPTSNPYQASCANGYDVFITKLGSSGSVLAFSTYLGGSDDDFGAGIALGTGGEAYIAGDTSSTDFPTENPYQASNPDRVIFISKLGSSGSVLTFSTYLGGSGGASGAGITLGTGGEAYVTGGTYSLDFPIENPYQATNNGNFDVIVSKLGSSGSVICYSTYLGGSDLDTEGGIALGTGGEAYIVGSTKSTDFPTENPYQGKHGGGEYDVFVSKLYYNPIPTCSATITPAPTEIPNPTSSPPPSPTPRFKISGLAQTGAGGSIENVAVHLSGYISDTSFTNSSGYYEFTGLPYGRNFTATPEKSSWVFIPSSVAIVGITSNLEWNWLGRLLTPTPTETPPTPTSAPPTPTPYPISSLLWIYDYNGDGTSDIAVFRGDSGLWSIRGVTRIYFGSATDFLVPGDYNGDGTTDIVIFRESSGMWSVTNLSRFYLGSTYDQPVQGDYNGDGTVEAGIFRETVGLWAIRNITRIYLGSLYDTVIPGYYDGDGTKDIAIFRGSTGMWSVRNITRFYFGAATDDLVPGDYNGAGKWEAGIFRPSFGMWSIRNVTRIYLGNSTDWALPADYDGNGTDDAGIFRDSTGMWSVRNLTRVYFGSTGDIPVTR